ncbi:hypothetical protein ACFLWN_00995 [Chloroflexota bacterium]
MGDLINTMKGVGKRLPLVPALYYYLCQLPGVALQRGLLLGSERFTAGERDLMARNQLKWRKLAETNNGSEGKGYVLVDTLVNGLPGFYYSGAIVGKYLSHLKHRRTLFLIENFYDTRIKRIIGSYGADGFIALNNPQLMGGGGADGRKIFRSLRSVEQLLEVEYGGLRIGDLIYDTYLSETREGTISQLDKEVFRRVLAAVRLKKFYEAIFKKYDISAVVLRDVVYSRMGLLARVALRHNAEVYVQRPLPPNIIRVRRYCDLKEIRTYQHRPSKALFDYVFQQHRDEAISGAEAYLQGRMNPEVPVQDRVDVWNAYGAGKVVLNRQEISSRLNLDAAKPMAVIMSHALTDAPHANNWQLFRDYLVWLRETLQFARDHPETNWLVKSHPSAGIYHCRQTETDEIATITRDVANHTIRQLPAEMSTRSLLEFADVVLTVCGTAGLEFSCYGIPCVLAGESPYSGFGFTVEPPAKEAYFRRLGDIKQVKRLTEEQVNRAKVVAYIYFILLGAETSFLSPDLLYIGRLSGEMAQRERERISRQADPSTDPFYLNFTRFLDADCQHLIRYPDFYRSYCDAAKNEGAITRV